MEPLTSLAYSVTLLRELFKERFDMKKKMLLFGSFGATLLSAALLLMPVKAHATPHCSVCTKVEGNVQTTAACRPVGRDGCACPLTGNITFNNCHFIP